jgi:hypothetical protein
MKYLELTADKILDPGEESLLLSYAVANPTWLVMPKLILTQRMQHDTPDYYSEMPPTKFRIELNTPVSGDPYILDEYEMTKTDLRRAEGLSLWGYEDACKVFATCPAACRVRLLICCLLDDNCPREVVV